MSGKVTPSAPGLQFQRDSHGPPFYSGRQHRKEEEGVHSSETDVVSIGISQNRFQEGVRPDHSDFENAVSFSQTQEGFLNLVVRALGKMTELSVRCQDEQWSAANRAEATVKFVQLQQFISDIGSKTFNGLALFSRATLNVSGDPVRSKSAPEPIRIESEAFGEDVVVAYDSRATAVSDRSQASVALLNIQRALRGLSELQVRVNTNLQRLSLSGEQLSALDQNLSDATQRINSIDGAGNMTQLARTRILRHSDTAKMAQANAVPQSAMKLLD
ncbi:MAG: flagellin [Verrucomicrobia bacterium]|nr:flagellin [Verrucomicrobiota bacterium]